MIRTRKPRSQKRIKPPPTPKRITPSIRLDAINPRDFNSYDFRFSCEDCSHYAAESRYCTMGYNAEVHLREVQLKTYELSGRVALCRALEID